LKILNLEGYKSPGTGQIPTELIQTACNILRYENLKLVRFILNKEKLHQHLSIYLFVETIIKVIVVIIDGYNC